MPCNKIIWWNGKLKATDYELQRSTIIVYGQFFHSQLNFKAIMLPLIICKANKSIGSKELRVKLNLLEKSVKKCEKIKLKE